MIRWAIVAAATREQAEAAIRLIRVKYQILPAILDAKTAKDNPVCIHPEENWRALVPCGADNRCNLVAEGRDESGDVEAELAACDIIIEQDYSTLANQQAMMETFRASTQLDAYGRLTVISSTQVPFHVRRNVATALGIPKNQVRVIKPRIGGGFGAKQTMVCEVYPAIVTMKTGLARDDRLYPRGIADDFQPAPRDEYPCAARRDEGRRDPRRGHVYAVQFRRIRRTWTRRRSGFPVTNPFRSIRII